MIASDIPYVPASILKKKSNVSRGIDKSRHTLETEVNHDGNAITSITKRSQFPSKSLAIVPSLKMSSANRFHPSRQENVSDIANINQNASAVSKNVSSNITATKPSKKKQKGHKNWFSDSDMPIYDAEYVEMVDEITNKSGSPKYKVSKVQKEPSEALRRASQEDNVVWITGEERPSKRGFKTVPSRDARNMGLANKSKSLKQASIASISKSKEKTKQSLMKRPSKQVQRQKVLII